MRVATFNVLHGRSLEDGRVDAARLSVEIGSLHADVLGLQEVDRAQPRSAHVDVAAVAAAAMGAGATHRFLPTPIGRPGGAWVAAGDRDDQRLDEPAYGVALITRLPVLSWHVLRLPSAPMRSVVAVPGARTRLALIRDEPRVMLAAVIDGPAGPMTVATTHLSFVPGWNVWQVRRICRELRRLPSPQILTMCCLTAQYLSSSPRPHGQCGFPTTAPSWSILTRAGLSCGPRSAFPPPWRCVARESRRSWRRRSGSRSAACCCTTSRRRTCGHRDHRRARP